MKKEVKDFLEFDIQYSVELHDLLNYLPFSSERMKIEKFENFFANLYNKNKYVIHIRNVKEALNYGLAFKKAKNDF